MFPTIQRPNKPETSGIFLAFFLRLVCATGARTELRSKQLGNAHGTYTITTMAGYWKQRVAACGCDVRRPAKHSGADGSLWRHRQEEMGDQLRLHVDVRFRVRVGRLDPIRLQHGVRRAMVPIPRQARTCDVGFIYHRPGDYSGCSCRHAGPRRPGHRRRP